MPSHVTDEERAQMVALRAEGYSMPKIATEVGRSVKTVQRVCAGLRSSTVMARAIYEAESATLARRAVEKANVDQILDIHDRLDVLPKKRDQVGPGQSFQVIIGMPGAPAMTPPTQAVIDAADPPKAVQALEGEIAEDEGSD